MFPSKQYGVEFPSPRHTSWVRCIASLATMKPFPLEGDILQDLFPWQEKSHVMSGYVWCQAIISSYVWCLSSIIWCDCILSSLSHNCSGFLSILISFNNSSVDENVFCSRFTTARVTLTKVWEGFYRYFIDTVWLPLEATRMSNLRKFLARKRQVTSPMAREIQRQSSSAIWVFPPFPQSFLLFSCVSGGGPPFLCSAYFWITHRLCLVRWVFEVEVENDKFGWMMDINPFIWKDMEREWKNIWETHVQSSNCKDPNSLDFRTNQVTAHFDHHVLQGFGRQESSYGITFVQLTTDL